MGTGPAPNESQFCHVLVPRASAQPHLPSCGPVGWGGGSGNLAQHAPVCVRPSVGCEYETERIVCVCECVCVHVCVGAMEGGGRQVLLQPGFRAPVLFPVSCLIWDSVEMQAGCKGAMHTGGT